MSARGNGFDFQFPDHNWSPSISQRINRQIERSGVSGKGLRHQRPGKVALRVWNKRCQPRDERGESVIVGWLPPRSSWWRPEMDTARSPTWTPPNKTHGQASVPARNLSVIPRLAGRRGSLPLQGFFRFASSWCVIERVHVNMETHPHNRWIEIPTKPYPTSRGSAHPMHAYP